MKNPLNNKNFNKAAYWLIMTLLISQIGIEAFAQNDRELKREKTPLNSAEKRLALVIGNGAYKHAAALGNPVNDAADMEQALKALGFEVISGTNQTKAQMQSLIRQFGNRLADTKAVGLFFYAGHGIAQNGTNYLIPVDADIQAEDEIEESSVSINFVLNKIEAANNGFNMVILDACRNNPFARRWRNYRDIGDKGGLTRIDAPTGTLIAYATKPGNVASDGTGRNGLYTSVLLQQMTVKNVEMGKMFQRVRAEVIKQSNGKQVPFDESSVVGDFYFAGSENIREQQSINNNRPTKSPNEPSVVLPKQTLPLHQIKKEAFFTFELQKCTKSGSAVTCEFTITNNESDDKPFEISFINRSTVIDDQGIEAVMISNQVGNKNGSERAILLPEVPVKAKITFKGIAQEAKEIKRLVLSCATKFNPTTVNGFKVEFRNISLE